MKQSRFFYFVLGIVSMVSVGGVTNQISQAGIALSDSAITFPDGSVQTTAAPTDTRRAFYLTATSFSSASGATAVCASGFHMASLWEIVDVSNLRYATDEESNQYGVLRRADSGLGPPSGSAAKGWIRTGGASSTSTSAGAGNCTAYSDFAGSGTAVHLSSAWSSVNEKSVIDPWIASSVSCLPSGGLRVWCVED